MQNEAVEISKLYNDERGTSFVNGVLNRLARNIGRQKKLEQKVMNVMPLFLLFYLDITSPGYLNVLYHNVLGVIFMTICLLGYIASVLLSERMGRIEV